MERQESYSEPLWQSKPLWMRQFFAEFFGTFFIVCIGDGAIANYLLNKDNQLGVDHFAVCFAFGVGVLIGISLAINISGAHLNPAVTIALTSLGEFPIRKALLYLSAQYLGAFMAAFGIYCAYYDAISAYDAGLRTPYKLNENTTSMTGGIFSTYPAPHVSLGGSIVDQVLATFLMMFAVMAITDEKGVNTPKHLQPTVLGLVIVGICVAFGLNCGAVLNPARDLGPRLFQLVAGYGSDVFRPIYSLYWLTAGIIGPHLGAIIGAWLYKITMSRPSKPVDNHSDGFKLNDIYSADNKQNQSPYNHKNSKEEYERTRPLVHKKTTEDNWSPDITSSVVRDNNC